MTFEEYWVEVMGPAGYSRSSQYYVASERMWEAATKAERERCAKIADDVYLEGYQDQGATINYRILKGNENAT